MGRIQKAYETRFYWLLQQVGARQAERGVNWLIGKARDWSARQGASQAAGLTAVYEGLACRPAFQKAAVRGGSPPGRFYCDAGLGGLARWLRAAGYEAWWESGIDDTDLLRQAEAKGATVVTTDSMLMERRLLRDRIIPSLWLPPTLSIEQQLTLVFREFRLRLRASRCMSCGGELERVDKEAMRDRIPPRTYRWVEEYFRCCACGQLFWHGTHWARIAATLRAVEAAGGG
jgi:uncharacterized protein with PIN domain